MFCNRNNTYTDIKITFLRIEHVQSDPNFCKNVLKNRFNNIIFTTNHFNSAQLTFGNMPPPKCNNLLHSYNPIKFRSNTEELAVNSKKLRHVNKATSKIILQENDLKHGIMQPEPTDSISQNAHKHTNCV